MLSETGHFSRDSENYNQKSICPACIETHRERGSLGISEGASGFVDFIIRVPADMSGSTEIHVDKGTVIYQLPPFLSKIVRIVCSVSFPEFSLF